MNRNQSIFRMMAVAGVCVATLVLGLSASAATMSDLMKYLPADAQIAVGLPDIAAVEVAGAPLLEVGPLTAINDLAWELGGDTLAEGLTKGGVNAFAPGVIFLSATSPQDISVCGVLMVSDEALVKETITDLAAGEGVEIDLPGENKGRDAGDVSYFIKDDKLFLASKVSLLEQLATRSAEPADVKYQTRDEVVIWSRIDIIENSGLLDMAEELAHLKPLINTIKPFSDEVLFAIGEEYGEAYVRAAARDNTETGVESPGPLGLHGYMDASAPLLVNLRITPTLINAVSMTLMNIPSMRQTAGYVRIASSLLGDEMAVSVRGMQSEKVPDATIAVTVKNPATVPNLLKMLAKIEEPTYQIDTTDVYVVEQKDIKIYIAVVGDALVITPGEEELKAALESMTKEGVGGVPADVVNKGVYGFVNFDGSKATDAGIDMPGIEDVEIALTMGLDNAWREVVLTSPAGFEGLASLLEEVM